MSIYIFMFVCKDFFSVIFPNDVCARHRNGGGPSECICLSDLRSVCDLTFLGRRWCDVDNWFCSGFDVYHTSE